MRPGHGRPDAGFLTGMWVEAYPEIAQRLADDPDFEPANHTYRHSAYMPNCHSLPRSGSR